MNILDFAIIIFILLELSNVIILYFKPDFKYGNGVSVFNAWNKMKEDENDHLFASYLVNWVGNSKLIFIALLIVIVIFGDETLKIITTGVLVLSISMYFVRLHSIIKKLDKNGQITPKNYSKTLAIMIGGFMAMFALAFVVAVVF